MGFLTRYDEELREPLMWRQGSQMSMRMARGSVSLLSSHGRGIPSSRRVEDGLLRSFSGCGRIPCVPSTCAGDLRELLRDTVQFGGASRDSSAFGGM